MGGGEDAHVHGLFGRTRQSARTDLFPARPQQLHLCMGRVGHFVQEQRAALGGLHETASCPRRRREAAALVTEELAFQQSSVGIARSSPRRTALRCVRRDSWINRATSSLPVPDSPKMCTGAWLRDTRAIISRSWFIACELPMSEAPVWRWSAPIRTGCRAGWRCRQASSEDAKVKRFGDEIECAELERTDRGLGRCRAR